jgi:tartrate dehydrogenase/decarboxylase/D-malate dehydrogenase
MKHYNIANIPGDGVGTEVAREALKVFDAAGQKFGFKASYENHDWGCDYFLKHGEMNPANMLETLTGSDAIFLGCIGDASKVPDHVSLQLLLKIRKGFDQYVNLRPINLYPGVHSPISTATPESVDFIVVRENTEGEYSSMGGFFKQGTPDAFAIQNAIFTYKGCERVMRYSFELAEKRKALGYPGQVTNCSKANALNYSMVFWDKIFAEVAAKHPTIKTDMALVDAMTMWFVKNPNFFDVIVASNLFGDIITDLASMLQGGMGFAAGGNINPERVYPSMFEPIHGSAPKYAGKNVINPVAAIETARMMLEHIGELDAAKAVQTAVKAVLAEGKVKTRDMGGSATTSEIGDAITASLLAAK